MRNLPVPMRDGDRDDLKNALNTYQYRGEARGYTATDAEVDTLLTLYDEYDDTRAVPSEALKGNGLPVELTQALHDAYDSTQKNRKLCHIRDLVFSNVEFCPVCGIDPPAELDHYLPQSDFKPLAIYVRNLVPLCHACNHTKLGFFSETDNERFPVLLQETLARHVRVIQRVGVELEVRVPKLETFGENVGVLTYDTFGLTASTTDFHKTLDLLIEGCDSIEEIESLFTPGLSAQARAYVMSRLASKGAEQ